MNMEEAYQQGAQAAQDDWDKELDTGVKQFSDNPFRTNTQAGRWWQRGYTGKRWHLDFLAASAQIADLKALGDAKALTIDGGAKATWVLSAGQDGIHMEAVFIGLDGKWSVSLSAIRERTFPILIGFSSENGVRPRLEHIFQMESLHIKEGKVTHAIYSTPDGMTKMHVVNDVACEAGFRPASM